ncbi:uncharacterized protein [Macaca fascicularis]|uniref:uncharacterized protein n=1 Tax=Macaca fascicularis TaxID=9541 RepID=UPI0032B0310F
MAPSRRGQQWRRRRAVRTDRTGAGCSGSQAARRLRAPPAGSARLPGRTRSAAPGGGGGGSGGGVVPSGRVLRDKTGSRSRGGATGAPGAGGEPRVGGQGGCAQPSRREAWGREGLRARSQDGVPRPCAPGTEGARAAPPGSARPPGFPSHPAPQRAPAAGWLPGTEPAEVGVRRRAGGARGGWTSLTHHARLRLQRRRRRRRRGEAGAQRPERASERKAAGSPPALVPERVREGARETHALTHPHTRERREGRGERGGERGEGRATALRRPRLHAWALRVRGKGTPFCFSAISAVEAPRHERSGQQLMNTANRVGQVGSEQG